MSTKSQQLQIRVTPRQKQLLRRAAAAAGQDVSTYVLSRALPVASARFVGLIRTLARGGDHRFVLAEVADLLAPLGAAELTEAVARADVGTLTPMLQNYLAAMVEHASHAQDVPPPPWTRDVAPLELPHFAGGLEALRPYLLRVSPVAFRRRNIFVDATIGSRV